MKKFARIISALGLAAVFAATAAFAQTPAPAPSSTHVKGYTRTLKSGKKVAVKGYDRSKMAKPKTTTVKGYAKTLKSGKTVSVKGYTRKVAPKGAKPAGTM